MTGRLVCLLCGRVYEYSPWARRCGCGGPLVYEPVSPGVARRALRVERGLGVWSFAELLPRLGRPGLGLGEAWTPLLPAGRLAGALGLGAVFLKNEGVNPTGTFIDRGSAVELWVARERGFGVVVSGGLGDHSVSVAAYTARYGLRLYAHVAGRLDLGRFYRIVLSGAVVYRDEDYGGAVENALRYARARGAYASIPLSPERIDGYRTLVYEAIVERREGFDAIVAPMGDGILVSSIYKALVELEDVIGGLPRVYAARLERGAVGPGLEELSVEKPLAGRAAEEAAERTGGGVVEVSARDVYEAMSLLARSEGVIADPAGAAGLAALRKLVEEGAVGARETVLVVLTGASSRDPLFLMEALRVDEELASRAERVLRGEETVMGDTKRRILELIARHGELHAYQLWKLLRDEGLDLSMPTVYQHLWSLEKAGLVEGVGRGARGRKPYRLTPRGFEILRRYAEG